MENKRNISLVGLILVLSLLFGMIPFSNVFALSNEIDEQHDYIVGYKKGNISALSNSEDKISSLGGKLEKNFNTINASKVKMTKKAAETLEKDPGVSFVEPDYPVFAASQTVDWGVERIYESENYPFESWNVTSGQGIKVAVLDTGINEEHEDIPILSGGYNIFGDGSYYGEDLNGHGTHVAGIISAKNNDIGTLGLAPAVDLYSVKVLDSSGNGSISTIIEGIQWAINNNIDIVNMSLGTYEYSEALELICTEAYNSGLLLVAAAGNSGNLEGTGSNINYPALFDTVIAVAASDTNDKRAYFSSTGTQAEITAPGEDILSTVPEDTLRSSLNISGSGITFITKLVEGSGIGEVSGELVDIGDASTIEGIENILLDKGISSTEEWIGLIDRGILTFSGKVSNAMSLGAAGAIIINDSESIFENQIVTLYASEKDKEIDWIPTIFIPFESGLAIKENYQYGEVKAYYSKYDSKSGTSMASPHVAGAAAVMWAANPTLTNKDIRYIITSTALDLGLPQEHQGYGLIQLNKGLDYVINNIGPIEKKGLSLSNFLAESKYYDGSKSAVGSFADNRDDGDLLEFSYDVEFEDKNAGQNKIVNFSNIEIVGGVDKNKYFLKTTTGQAISNISPAVLSAEPKSPKIVYGDPIPEYYIEFKGFVEGEDESILTSNESLIISDYDQYSPPGVYNLTISAITATAINYKFVVQETDIFEVDKKPLTIKGSFVAGDKIFDGTKSADILENNLSLEGVVNDDEVSLTDIKVEFTSSEVGNGIEVLIKEIGLEGKHADNYNLNLDNMPSSYADINSIPEENPEPAPRPPSTGGSRGGGSFTVVEEDPVYGLINDEKIEIGTFIVEKIDGINNTLITLDEDKIMDIDISSSKLSIVPGNEYSNIEVIINKKIFDFLYENSMEIEIITDIGGFIIPINSLSIETSIEDIGENIKEERLRLIFKISTLDEEKYENIKNKAAEKSMEIITEIIEFDTLLKYGSSELLIKEFKGFTTKLIPLDEDIDIEKPILGVIFDEDDNFRYLTSKVSTIDDKAYVLIRSIDNGIYTGISQEVYSLEVVNHWSKDAFEYLILKSVITNPEKYEPEEYITREDFASYITRALGLKNSDNTSISFNDVEESNLIWKEIETAAEYGIIRGYEDGAFKPKNRISRQEAMTMYARAMKLVGLSYKDEERILNYSDRAKVANWAYKDVKSVLDAGVFNGTSKTTISPEATFKYAEAATAIKNLLELILKEL